MPLRAVPVTDRCQLVVSCVLSRGASWPPRCTKPTLRIVGNLTAGPGGETMQADAHNDTGREERRAQLEERRAAVAREMRRLARELADLDRQLDEIEQADRGSKDDER